MPEVRIRPRFALPIVLLTACGAEPPPPPVVVPVQTVAVEPEPVAPPPEPDARWVRSDGGTFVGPSWPEGTLVVVGGRRVLVAPDGSHKSPEIEASEALEELAQVPLPGGATALVGRSAHTLFRFAGPLGAPTVLGRSDDVIDQLGTAPGLVALWRGRFSAPIFIDPTDGTLRPGPKLPALPAKAMMFRSLSEGAAIFDSAGLFATNDGGASFRPVASTANDQLRVTGLRARSVSQTSPILAFVYADGLESPVDPSAFALGPMQEPPAPKDEPKLLRWVRTTGRDPLEAAVSSGVLDHDGNAITASHGLVARIALPSGELKELMILGATPSPLPCSADRWGDNVLLGCALPAEEENDLYDPFGIVTVPRMGPLRHDRPLLARNGESLVRVSPRGGVMLLGACDGTEGGDACVRSPSGRFETVSVDQDLVERGAGPLADGRVAYIRGLYEGDEPPLPVEGAPRSDLGFPSPYVVFSDGLGHETWLASSAWTGRTAGAFTVAAPLVEADDGTLRFALSNEEGVFAFTLVPKAAPTSPTRIDGARAVYLRGEHGAAVGPSRLMLSADGGRSWTESALQPPIAEALERVDASAYDATRFVASDVGLRLDNWLRIGWKSNEVSVAPTPEPTGAVWPSQVPAERPASPALTCKKGAKSQALAYMLTSDETTRVLGPEKPAAQGIKRATSAMSAQRLPGVSALLIEEGPEKSDVKPAQWTFVWQDPLEIGGGKHRVTTTAPEGSGRGAQLRSVAARGARAFFTVRAGGKTFAAWVTGPNKVQITSIRSDDIPVGEVVFGPTAKDPIVWLRSQSIIGLLGDGPPRPLFSLAGGTQRFLAEPSITTVPFILSSNELAQSIQLPLPKAPPDAPAALPLDGFQPTAKLNRVASFGPCTATSKGRRVTVYEPGLDLFYGDKKRNMRAAYVLRVEGEQACIESLAAASGSASSSQGGLLSFVRADFAKKKAEGSYLDESKKREVVTLDCSLGAPPAK